METEGFSSHSGFIKCFPFLIFSILCICKGTIGQIYTCLTTLERELRRKPSHLRQDLSSAVRSCISGAKPSRVEGEDDAEESWAPKGQENSPRWAETGKCNWKANSSKPVVNDISTILGARTCYAWQAVGNRWGSLAKSSRSQEHGVLWCLEHWLQLGKPKLTSCGGRVHTAHYISAKIRFRLVHSMVDLLPDQVNI